MKLHWKIIIGIIIGLCYAIVITSVSDSFQDLNSNGVWDDSESFIDSNDNDQFDDGEEFTDSNKNKKWDIAENFTDGDGNGQFDGGYILFTNNWIEPFGKIFLNLITLFAIPLILVSLIKGICSISDISRLSKMGIKTLAIYITTTIISVSIGLLLVNTFKPGANLSNKEYSESYQQHVDSKKENVDEAKKRGPLQPLVDIVPNNIFDSASSNKKMLQIVFISILIGIGLLSIPKDQSAPILRVVDILNELLFTLIGFVMKFAPIGAFALIASSIVQFTTSQGVQLGVMLQSIAGYFFLVVVGLAIHTFIIYPLIIKFIAKKSITDFFKGISRAQLLAFSTSSSAATLPVTMNCCEENLKVKKEVSSFVLPIGSTVNMDGTALYQSIAAVFIAQALGVDLTFYNQISIMIMTVIASIGTAAVPSAGIVMLIIILDSIGIGGAGVALIIGVDRILDMLRTTTNVTGDAAVTLTINEIEKSS